MDILIKQEDTKGYAIAMENDQKAGMMTFSITGPNLIIIDHTEVEPAFQGKMVGKQMLYKVVEMARNKETKIIPLCPFAAAMFKKISEIRDVLK